MTVLMENTGDSVTGIAINNELPDKSFRPSF